MKYPIYLDYNATTPIDKRVADAMRPYLEEYFGNPSSTHEYGVKAMEAVMKARKQIAKLINCEPDEIIFTSGGSESNNYAIKGITRAQKDKGNHIITSRIEHPAVSEVCKFLEDEGYRITYLDVDQYGVIDPEAVEAAITTQTILITIMHANNEVGTIQPVEAIGQIAREKGIVFHSDAAQSVGKIRVDVKDSKIDLLSIAGHKLYAPKGIGALYIRRGINLAKLIHGADHEMNKRAGTENVLEIVGLGEACEIADRDFEKNTRHMTEMRDLLYSEIQQLIPGARLNGHPDHRLPNTLSIAFRNIEANTLLSELHEVAASAGAACHTDSIDISSVLEAMNVPIDYAMGTIRFSTGKYNTKEEIKDAAKHISKTVKSLGSKDQIKSDYNPADDIKLTRYTHGLGCACKIRPQYLEKVLQDMPLPMDKNVLISLSSSDDAAIYKINDTTAVIQTVDFFTPIVDDPYHFGAIAAANALSDVYAMGGKPLFALNIVGFPDNRLPVEVLRQILKGASDKAAEAGIHVLGGHTIEDNEPKFGMTVTGIVHPDKILRNDTLQPGDALIYTKAIGTGIISTAIKRGIASEQIRDEAIRTMSELNAKAAEVISSLPVNACTDITGFGLLGHLLEMVRPGKVDVEIDPANIILLPGAYDFAIGNIIPGGTKNNMEYVSEYVDYDPELPDIYRILLNDAQTSGGLLIALPGEYKSNLLNSLKNAGIKHAECIGNVVNKGVGKISVKGI